MLILCTGMYTSSIAQDLYYSVWQKGKLIGETQVCKYEVYGVTTYELYSHLKVNLLFPIKISQNLVAVYKNDVLVFASTQNYLNENLHSPSTVVRKDNGYNMLLNDDKVTKHNGAITFSGVRLFYTEPKQVSRVFSESYGRANSIVQTGEDTYRLTSSNNQINTYTYRSGRLMLLNASNRLLKLEMKLEKYADQVNHLHPNFT